ncbi:hypothetical protein [Nocardia wallacei]|uniref:hypothetical protein n=1 Tax=Nocardia wallacei TaxID=480035 RepID=UPI003CC7FFBC
MFHGPAGFSGVRFAGPVTFSSADFGSEPVVFEARHDGARPNRNSTGITTPKRSRQISHRTSGHRR